MCKYTKGRAVQPELIGLFSGNKFRSEVSKSQRRCDNDKSVIIFIAIIVLPLFLSEICVVYLLLPTSPALLEALPTENLLWVILKAMEGPPFSRLRECLWMCPKIQ